MSSFNQKMIRNSCVVILYLAFSPLFVRALNIGELGSSTLCGASVTSTLVLVNRSSPSYLVDSASFNTAVQTRPSTIAFAHSVDDVVCALALALNTSRNITDAFVNIRSGRHDFCSFSAEDNAFVIDVSNLTSMALSPDNTFVDVGPGVRLFTLYDFLANRSLLFPGGSCPQVAISGLVLGGGHGINLRSHGLSSDSLLEADIVTVDNSGNIKVNTVRRNSSLFWALRGGGSGNFGVITRFRLRVYPVPEQISSLTITFPTLSRLAAFSLFERVSPFASDNLETLFTLTRGAAKIDFTYRGDSAGLLAAAEVKSFIAINGSQMGPILALSWIDLVVKLGLCDNLTSCRSLMSHWPDPHSIYFFGGSSNYISSPIAGNAEGMASFFGQIDSLDPTIRSTIMMKAYGGEANRINSQNTAFVHRNALYHIESAAIWDSPDQGPIANEWLRGIFEILGDMGSKESYRSYPNTLYSYPNERYFGGNLKRLQSIKSVVDPLGIFRYKQSF